MLVPEKQRTRIRQFDVRTQQEAFAVSLEGLKGVCFGLSLFLSWLLTWSCSAVERNHTDRRICAGAGGPKETGACQLCPRTPGRLFFLLSRKNSSGWQRRNRPRQQQRCRRWQAQARLLSYNLSLSRHTGVPRPHPRYHQHPNRLEPRDLSHLWFHALAQRCHVPALPSPDPARRCQDPRRLHHH